MADQTEVSIAELRRVVQDKERQLAEMDLMLADYQTERSRLIRELRRLRAQYRDAEEASLSVQRP